MNLFDVDWQKMFLEDVALLELFLRGTILYLCVYFLFRFVIKRVGASVSIANILVIVLIADFVSNGAQGDAKSVTGGIVLALTTGFWNTALEFLEYHVPAFRKLLYHPPMQIVRDGQFLHQALRRHLLTEEEVMVELRHQGETDISVVHEAFMENNGDISFIMKKQ